jgi:PAS domain S-box-containing protein
MGTTSALPRSTAAVLRTPQTTAAVALAVAGSGCAAAYSLAVAAHPSAPRAAPVWALAMYMGVYGCTAALCAVAAAGAPSRERRNAWAAMAAAPCAVLLAIAVNRFATEVGSRSAHVAADLLAVLYYPAVAVGLTAMGPARRSRIGRHKFALDLAIVLAAAVALAVYIWQQRSGAGLAPTREALVYFVLTPASAFVAAFAVSALALRPPAGGLAAPVLAAMGSVMLSALSDFAAFVHYPLPQAANAVGWTIATWMLGAGAFLAQRSPSAASAVHGHAPEDRYHYSALPYAAVAVVGAFLLWELPSLGGGPARALLVGGVGVTALVVVRQIVALREINDLVGARLSQDARFRGLVQRSSDALLIVDEAGRIDYHSPSLAGMSGRAEEDHVGRSFLDVVGAVDGESVTRALGRVAARRGAVELLTIDGRLPDGTSRRLEVLAGNRLDDDAIGGLVLNVRDVTERHRLHSQLADAQKMEAVGRLAGGVAHDFNNLLTAIIGYAELLERGFASGSASVADVREIRRAGTRAAQLTRQLLTFSRREAKQPQALVVNEVVVESARMLRRLAGTHIAVVTDLEPRAWTVRADPGELEQVLVNRVVNARDAMPDGGTLTIVTRNVVLDGVNAPLPPGLAAGAYVVIDVADTGNGMSDETRAQIFEPFFTTKTEGEGTGLGLATVYGIVSAAGGVIAVQTQPGRGSTFTIHLPRYHARPAATAAALAEATPASRPGHGRVLVVDDDDAVRGFAVRTLHALGYTVLAASDGERALAAVRDDEGDGSAIDLLVADVVMPGMGGAKLAATLCTHFPAVRVLFTSGHADQQFLREELLGDEAVLLPKPFTAAQLTAAVEARLDPAAMAGTESRGAGRTASTAG